MSLVAVSLKDKTSLKSLKEMKKAGVDIFELRIDHFSLSRPEYVLHQISRLKKFPLLLTVRSKNEGGKWRGSEAKRLGLFLRAIPKVKMVDVELSSKAILSAVIRAAKKNKKKVIVSYHNFKQTPPKNKLAQILVQAKKAGADIVKIAVMPKDHKDVQSLLDFTKANAGKKIITIAMGEQGAISRVLFPKFGSMITYASSDSKSVAPGQLDYKTTLKLLGRWK